MPQKQIENRKKIQSERMRSELVLNSWLKTQISPYNVCILCILRIKTHSLVCPSKQSQVSLGPHLRFKQENHDDLKVKDEDMEDDDDNGDNDGDFLPK